MKATPLQGKYFTAAKRFFEKNGIDPAERIPGGFNAFAPYEKNFYYRHHDIDIPLSTVSNRYSVDSGYKYMAVPKKSHIDDIPPELPYAQKLIKHTASLEQDRDVLNDGKPGMYLGMWRHKLGGPEHFIIHAGGLDVTQEDFAKDPEKYVHMHEHLWSAMVHLYARAVNPTLPEAERQDAALTLYSLFSHDCPLERGSATAARIILEFLGKKTGLNILPSRVGTDLNIEAITSSPEEFVRDFKSGMFFDQEAKVNPEIASASILHWQEQAAGRAGACGLRTDATISHPARR